MDVTNEDEFHGLCLLGLINGTTIPVKIDHTIRDNAGHILFLVSTDNTYYNFNTVVWIKKVGT